MSCEVTGINNLRLAAIAPHMKKEDVNKLNKRLDKQQNQLMIDLLKSKDD